MRASTHAFAVLLTAGLACHGDDSGTASATTTTTMATTTSTSSSTSSTSDSSGDSDTTVNSESASGPGTTTTTTGGDFHCPQNACFACHSVSDEGGGLPFPICTNLRWDCDFPSPCDYVGLNQIEPGVYEATDVDAAICTLTAMMGDQPAALPFFDTSTPPTILVVGDGTAMIQWDVAGGDYNAAARSGRLVLQDASYFEACLADPTPLNLGACLFAGSNYCAGDEPWTPPWSTGECSFSIPEGCTKG